MKKRVSGAKVVILSKQFVFIWAGPVCHVDLLRWTGLAHATLAWSKATPLIIGL